VWLRWVRILEKETQHFLRCVRPLRIGIGAGRAASGPGVAGTVDTCPPACATAPDRILTTSYGRDGGRTARKPTPKPEEVWSAIRSIYGRSHPIVSVSQFTIASVRIRTALPVDGLLCSRRCC
jgi:hypothetical protein